MMNLTLYRLQVIQLQVDNGIPDVGHLVQLLQLMDHLIPNKTARHLGFAQLLQLRLNFTGNALNIGRRHRPFGARNAQTSHQLIT